MGKLRIRVPDLILMVGTGPAMQLQTGGANAHDAFDALLHAARVHLVGRGLGMRACNLDTAGPGRDVLSLAYPLWPNPTCGEKAGRRAQRSMR